MAKPEHIAPDEWQVRCDLAALYRLAALHGWDDLIFTHISARVPGPEHHFLINPYGMMFEEITASSLVKVDRAGAKVGHSDYDVNPAGFIIHSAVHEAREEAHFVMHLHTLAGVAVSAQREGLLPISQHSLFALASLSYHDYEGVALNPDEKARLVRDLGRTSLMMLRNHGLLTLGHSAADTFLKMFMLQRSCEIQIGAQAGGTELIRIPPAILAGIGAQRDKVMRGSGAELAWPGLLRRLGRQNPGHDA
jgi:ribulose-5-phosphate 4-epimerase/fuculose-1-phosphate aldolase